MKIRLLAVTFSVLLIFACLSFTASAETTPADIATPTEDVFATEEATVYTDTAIDTGAVTDPYDPTGPVDTGSVDTTPSDYTEPYSSEATGTTETTAVTDPTTATVHTNPPEPTEPDEDSTFSDYVSPQPVYTPAEQDFQENDWQAIKLDLEADPVAGKQNFASIQNNNSKGNDSIVGFLIVGLVLVFLSLAGFTFVILYRPYKKKAPTKAARYAENTRQRRNPSERPERTNRRQLNPDDYNDGF
ncbi:MAG: hypothetical protein Q4B92_06395 [Ruminococcus sp.]|nr:hypothetical protein [Ruminococcus sp.]